MYLYTSIYLYIYTYLHISLVNPQWERRWSRCGVDIFMPSG